MEDETNEVVKALPIETIGTKEDRTYGVPINYTEIGNKIRVERENFSMTREKLSELLNISPNFLGQIERGERNMSVNTLVNISECLHVSIDYLFFGQQNSKDNNNLHSLIDRCSEKEAKVIESIVKLILPHIAR